MFEDLDSHIKSCSISIAIINNSSIVMAITRSTLVDMVIEFAFSNENHEVTANGRLSVKPPNHSTNRLGNRSVSVAVRHGDHLG